MQAQAHALMATSHTGRAFDLTVLDNFIELGSATIFRLAGLDLQYQQARAAGTDELRFARSIFNGDLFSQLDSYREDWVAQMAAQLGEAGFRSGASLFQLHCGAIQAEAGTDGVAGLQRVLLRDLVGPLLLPMRPGASPGGFFSAGDATNALCQTMALMLAAAKPLTWQPSWFCNHAVQFSRHFWPAFDEAAGAVLLRPLCRQIVEQQIWLMPDGQFSPERAPGAVAHALCIPAQFEATLWRQRLRGLLVEALRRDWIDGAEAEAVIAREPALEPWWLLASSSADMQAERPGLRAFQARLRARFPARLAELARSDAPDPSLLINMRFDREHVVEWRGGYQTEYAYPYGSEGLVGALRWISAHPGKFGPRAQDPWADLMRRLAYVRALDSAENADALVKVLAQFPMAALGAVLPWACSCQPMVLQAMGLAALEPLRCWLVTQLGANPRAPGWLGDAMGNDSNPADGVIDLHGLLRATAGIDTRQCEKLAALYVKAGMARGMDKLIAAALGLAQRAQLFEAALVKQNQDAIKQLGLLPGSGAEDVRERYLALQQLQRQARQHGAQRQATQLGAVQAGLANLAQVAGFADRAELEWTVEASQGSALQQYFAAAPYGQYAAWIAIAGLKPALMVNNPAGKAVSAVPAALKKDPAFAPLQGMYAEVREQIARFTRLMENRMMDASAFTAAQLDAALDHPVMAPIVASLAWTDTDGHTGLLRNGALEGPDGRRERTGDLLRLVHPAQLLLRDGGAGLLARWQRWLVGEQVVQAFKQMFREIYVPTPAELEWGTESARYDGRAIRTGITQAILQSRLWVPPEGEEGSHRRLFADGVSAHCGFTAGHHFTEAQTEQLLTMWFMQAGVRMPLVQVPAAAFSEAMRDIDLVLAKAGVGEDEQPVSHATMAARAQLLTAIAQVFSDGTVTIAEPYVLVRGKLASYRIHLGSGHVHIEPGAYLCIVPAASLTALGSKLRLPFAEDDLQTAALVSKVMLLIDDDRIKDAGILAQIGAGR